MWIQLLLVSACVLQAWSGDTKGEVKVSGRPEVTDSEPSCSANPNLDSCSASNVRRPRSLLLDDEEYSRHVRAIRQKSDSKGLKKKSRVTRSADNREVVGAAEEVLPQGHILPRYGPNPVVPREIYQAQDNSRPMPTQFLTHARYCPHCRQLLPPTPAVLQPLTDPRVFQQFQNPQTFPVRQFTQQQPSSGVYPGGYDNNPGQNFASSFFPEEMCPYDNGDQGTVEALSPKVNSNQNFFNQTSPKTQKSNSNIIKMNSKKTLTDVQGKYAGAAESDKGPEVSSSSKLAGTNTHSLGKLKDIKLPNIEELARFLESKKSN